MASRSALRFREEITKFADSCALIYGLDSTNVIGTTLRALIEGILIGLAHGMERLVDLGISADELRISGGEAKSATMRQIVSDIFGLPVIGFKISEGAAFGSPIQAAWTNCETKGKPLPFEKIVNSTVKTDGKTRAELWKQNGTFYAELRGPHADFARKMASSGYL